MESGVIKFSLHRSNRLLMYGTAAVAITLASTIWLASDGEWDGGMILPFGEAAFFAVAVYCLTDVVALVIPMQAKIVREVRFLGLLLWRSHRPFSQFAAIGFLRIKASEPGDSECVYVGFLSASGRISEVKYFYCAQGETSEEAIRFGSQLSGITGLPLIHSGESS